MIMKRLTQTLIVLILVLVSNVVSQMDTTRSMKKMRGYGSGQGMMMADQSQKMIKTPQGRRGFMHGMDGCPMMETGMSGSGMMERGQFTDPVLRSMHDQGCAGVFMTHAEILELTSSQIDELRQLRVEFQKEMVQMQADFKIQMIELNELLSAAEWNTIMIERKLDSISDQQTKIRKALLRSMEESRAVLTSEQREKWNSM